MLHAVTDPVPSSWAHQSRENRIRAPVGAGACGPYASHADGSRAWAFLIGCLFAVYGVLVLAPSSLIEFFPI